MTTYSDKLKDPRWQKKRLKILERDNWTCVFCDDNKEELQVHHEKYNGEPWDADDKFLKTCCWACHSAISFLGKTDVNYEKTIKCLKKEIASKGINMCMLGCARKYEPYMFFITSPLKGTGQPWVNFIIKQVDFQELSDWSINALSSKYYI